MKVKKGQILILTLIVMAIGLIIISPLLRYMDSSYTQYLHVSIQADAYYTADAMMSNILKDIYSGTDVYSQNISSPYNLLNPSNGSGYLNNGYNVSVSINNSIPHSLDIPKTGNGWIYMDPGIRICNTSTCNTSLLLKSLGSGLTHDFPIYLVGGSQVQVCWSFDDSAASGCKVCPYYCNGSIWIAYANNGSEVAGTRVSNGSAASHALHLLMNYSVPAGTSGNYIIKFQNLAYRQTPNPVGCICVNPTTGRPANSSSFVANGDTDYTWVRAGKVIGNEVYSFQDYMITVTARNNNQNQDIVSITAYVRHTPGPFARWMEQTVEIPGWQITYY